MNDRPVASEERVTAPASGTPLVTVRGLRKDYRFKGPVRFIFQAVKQADFTLYKAHPGAWWANPASGKTTHRY